MKCFIISLKNCAINTQFLEEDYQEGHQQHNRGDKALELARSARFRQKSSSPKRGERALVSALIPTPMVPTVVASVRGKSNGYQV